MVAPMATDPSISGASLWRQAWYPVAYLRDLDPRRPTAFTLLEQDLVLWFEDSSQR